MTAIRVRFLLSAALGLVLLATAFSAGQFATPTSAAANSLGDTVEVVLAPKGYVVLPDGTRLTFARVVSDSRCPTDVVCIWQGEVVAGFGIQTEDSDPRDFEITFDGSPSTETIEGYAITVTDVQPSRQSTQPIDADDYRVTVTISAADEQSRVITYADFGGTVEVNVGQTIVVDPDRAYVWRAQVDDPTILEPLPTIAIYPPEPPPFRAVAAGETDLHITREQLCLHASPACLAPDHEYLVHIVVR